MRTLKRTQMYFPEDMLAELKRKAEVEHTTISNIVRNAVTSILHRENKKDWSNDPVWNMVGTGNSTEGDLSMHHDKYLYGKK